MSHYSIINTQLADQKALCQALSDLGFLTVEVHEEAQQLVGYRGDLRKDTAEIIIRRKHIGQASNDIGFKLGDDGLYKAIISDFDKKKYGEKWIAQLSQRYAYHATTTALKQQGFEIIEDKEEGEQVHLRARRMQ